MFVNLMSWLADLLEGAVLAMPTIWVYMNQTMFQLGDVTITPLSMLSLGGIMAIVAYKAVRFLVV